MEWFLAIILYGNQAGTLHEVPRGTRENCERMKADVLKLAPRFGHKIEGAYCVALTKDKPA